MSLRPTFMGFETMRNAINAAQKALDITGGNIGNVNTQGYSRQRLDLFAKNTPSGSLRYNTAVGLAGQGVGVSGVAQMRDPFLDKAYRNLTSDAASSGTNVSILSEIQDILDQFTTDGFNTSFEALRNALSSYSSNNADRGEIANITLQNANQMVQALRSYNSKLQTTKAEAKSEMNTAVDRVTAIFKALGTLNGQIVNGYLASGDIIRDGDDYHANTKYGPNELKDERNILLDELASYGNIKVDDNKNGSVTVYFAGQEVVNDQKVKSIEMIEHSTGAISYNIVGTGGTRTPIKATAESLSGGALRGYLDVYNGAGVYAGDPANRMQGVEAEVKEIRRLMNDVAAAFKAVPPVDITVPRPGTSISLLTELQGHGNFALVGGVLTLEGEEMVSADGTNIKSIDVVTDASNTGLEIRLGGKTLNRAGVKYDVDRINQLLKSVVDGTANADHMFGEITKYDLEQGNYNTAKGDYDRRAVAYDAKIAEETAHKAEYDKQMKIFNDPATSAADKAAAKTAADAAKVLADTAKADAATMKVDMDVVKEQMNTATAESNKLYNALRAKYDPDITRDDKTGVIQYRGSDIYKPADSTVTPPLASVITRPTPLTEGDIFAELQKYGDFQIANPGTPGPPVVPPSGAITLDGQDVLDMAAGPPITFNELLLSNADTMDISIGGVNVDMGPGSITSKKAEGQLLNVTMGGLADALNESNEVNFTTTTNGILYYQNTIDALANTIARSFNAAASDENFIDPKTGEYFIRAMFSPSDRGEKITAGNIAITQEWLDDPAMIAKHVEWKDPLDHSKGIQSKVTPKEELDTTFLQKLSAVAESKLNFSLSTDRVGDINKIVSFNMTIGKYSAQMSNTLGGDISYMTGVFKADSASAGIRLDERDGIMAVDINEEGTNMMNFQKWFNASSRMLTTLDEALNTIINSMGLVGR